MYGGNRNKCKSHKLWDLKTNLWLHVKRTDETQSQVLDIAMNHLAKMEVTLIESILLRQEAFFLHLAYR